MWDCPNCGTTAIINQEFCPSCFEARPEIPVSEVGEMAETNGEPPDGPDPAEIAPDAGEPPDGPDSPPDAAPSPGGYSEGEPAAGGFLVSDSDWGR
jgi:hypothetical protein